MQRSNANVGVYIVSARILGCQLVGIGNAKRSHWGVNQHEAFWWNIGYRLLVGNLRDITSEVNCLESIVSMIRQRAVRMGF